MEGSIHQGGEVISSYHSVSCHGFLLPKFIPGLLSSAALILPQLTGIQSCSVQNKGYYMSSETQL